MDRAVSRSRTIRSEQSKTLSALPHDCEVERCFLGCLLAGGNDDRIERKHFADTFHADMFTAIGELRVRGIPLDAVLVTRRMISTGHQWELTKCTKVLECVIHDAHTECYANILIDLWRRRRMIQAADYLVRRAYDPTKDVDETWRKIEEGDT